MNVTQNTSSLGSETDKSFEKLMGEMTVMKTELKEAVHSTEEIAEVLKELFQKDIL